MWRDEDDESDADQRPNDNEPQRMRDDDDERHTTTTTHNATTTTTVQSTCDKGQIINYDNQLLDRQLYDSLTTTHGNGLLPGAINGDVRRAIAMLAERACVRGEKLLSAGSDRWTEMPDSCVRIHARPRRSLFTPIRVAGAPPAKTLCNSRVTTGMYLSSKKIFSVVDSWHARSTAHRVLEEPWIGVTQFLRQGQFREREVPTLPDGQPDAFDKPTRGYRNRFVRGGVWEVPDPSPSMSSKHYSFSTEPRKTSASG